MKLYGGIDLHSNNSVIALLDEADQVVYRRRLPNDLEIVLAELEPYGDAIEGLVVESTYNWYWLVDGLMEAGYRVHLANTAAIVQYAGLKYADDDTDACWLAKLLRLGLLPEGYIYPKAQRPVRDLLRKRSQLVHQRTSNLQSIQNLLARNRGRSLGANQVKRLSYEDVDRLLPDFDLALAVKSTLAVMRTLGRHDHRAGEGGQGADQAAPRVRTLADRQRHRPDPGADHHAGDRRDRALCQGGQLCFLLPLCGQRTLEQWQAQGPRQHQERQPVSGLGLHRGGELRGALQPPDQALLPAQAGPHQRYRRHQDDRPQAGAGLLLHPARPGVL